MNSHAHPYLAALVPVLLALGACTTIPARDAALEDARVAVASAQRDPQVVSLDGLMAAGHPGPSETPMHASPAAYAERAELGAALEQALAQIRPEYRGVIVLHYQEGLGHAEIADIIGVPVGTVKTYLHRGRKELATAMTARGWRPTETLPRTEP